MAQWLVMQGDTKFPVDSFADIEAMARRGALRGGHMIQPPGATEWLYVSDVPELKALLASARVDDDDDDVKPRGLSGAVIGAIVGVVGIGFVFVILIGGGALVYLADQLQGSSTALLGEGGLRFSEMIVTDPSAGLRGEPSEDARVTTPLQKDSTLELLAKRGNFYRARSADGVEGWVRTDQVIPMYQLAGAAVRQEYDPLYNPDRYVEVANARWMQLPGEKRGELSNVTAFEFMVTNESSYPMTDLKIRTIIKDAQGHELEEVEIAVEGQIPAGESSFVGTLSSETEAEKAKGRAKPEEGEPDRVMTTWSFEQMAASDPDLQLRWTSGVEVEMRTESFANAEIDVVELRAVPDQEAAEVVRRD